MHENHQKTDNRNLHKNIGHRFSVLFIFLAFSLSSFYLFELAVTSINSFIYQIVVGIFIGVLYLNFLPFFFKEAFIRATRVNFTKVIFGFLYLFSLWVVVAPIIVSPTPVQDSLWIRNVIIIFAYIMLGKYFIYMVISPIHSIWYPLKKKKLLTKNKNYAPKVSVLVPAWNEEVGIISTVESILHSSYKNLEVIVVNDGSSDRTDSLMRAYLDSHDANNPRKLRYHYKENGGKGSALNKAVEMATGDILISVDADCYVTERAVQNFVDIFRDPKTMAAVGNVKIANQETGIGLAQFLEYLFTFYLKKTESLLGSIYIIGGAAGAFRKEVFETIGDYRLDNITEDIELTVRIQDAGMKIAYAPDAIVYTEGASDIHSLAKQRIRWKRGRFQTFFQNPQIFFSFKKKHNKILSFLILPLALLSEFQLLLEIPFLLFLYAYAITTSDYTSFLAGIMVVGLMFIVQIIFEEPKVRNWKYVALIPIGWLIFYLLTAIEVNALVKSISSIIRKKEVVWQKWDRKGLGGQMENTTIQTS